MQNLLGEAAAAGTQADGAGDPIGSSQFQGRDVEVDGGADQVGQDRGEVHVQEEAGGGRQSARVGQELFDGRAQAAGRASVQQPGAVFGGVGSDFLAGRIAQVPQVAFQVDERHRGTLAGRGGAGHGRAEVVERRTPAGLPNLDRACDVA
jgi:hypothetical protein